MPATVTVTGKAGAGVTVTAGVYNNVDSVQFLCGPGQDILKMQDNTGYIYEVTIVAATTITATKTGNTYTFTVS